MQTGTKKELVCKLTSPELRKRNDVVIASLKSKILEKQEIKEGYRYKFTSSDRIIDELAEFIRTERLCCDFFAFDLSINGDDAWLSISGPEGAKQFIKEELEL